jgi:uncharacterized protein YecE (DUF72 family)
MKFGQVNDPSKVDFTLPSDHHDNAALFKKSKKKKPVFFIGCAKWNKTDLKNFYPKGVKDELEYYSQHFNCIELNAIFYRLFPVAQFEKWKEKTPEGFKFFPKITQDISHRKRLNGVEDLVDNYVHHVRHLGDKLGSVFLQLRDDFAPKDFERIVRFVEYWPKDVQLAVEVRHPDWFSNASVANELYALLETHGVTNVLVDTAGRRDMLHMRHTNKSTFVRYVGANHPSDYPRLDEWVERIAEWVDLGIEEINFFVHQNIELESPLLSVYFIEQLNKKLGLNHKVPAVLKK